MLPTSWPEEWDKKAIQLFNQNNINAFVGAPKKEAKELVVEFLEEKTCTNIELLQPLI